MTAAPQSLTANPLVRLGELGQSPWYDYITRDLVMTGELARLIADDGLRGMTSNPTIFEKAIAGSRLYDAEIRQQSDAGRSAQEIFEHVAVADVRAACDAFAGVYEATHGSDGLVSLEVSPALIKIPGTREGLPAITHCTAAGINVNVTLLFSVERYGEVIEAFLAGLERRHAAGRSVGTLASVASFFVSRVDGKVDPLLDRLGDPHGLRGRIAIANACAAYRLFERSLGTPRWDRLAKAGASPQRPLWASTSTKDPRYPDVHYVEALVAPRTVNTLPPETFAAYRDHGRPAVRIDEGMAAAPQQLEALAQLGIDLPAITRELEVDGVAKFAASYASLLAGIDAKADTLVGR
jgi:transaldolase